MSYKLNNEKTYHWYFTKIKPCEISVYQRQTI